MPYAWANAGGGTVTRQEIVAKATEEIIALQEQGMLESALIELVLQSALLDCENMAVEKQLESLDRSLDNMPEDNWEEDR